MERQAISINEMRGISECAAPRPTDMKVEAHDEIASQTRDFLARGGEIQQLPSNFASNPVYAFDRSRVISRG